MWVLPILPPTPLNLSSRPNRALARSHRASRASPPQRSLQPGARTSPLQLDEPEAVTDEELGGVHEVVWAFEDGGDSEDESLG